MLPSHIGPSDKRRILSWLAAMQAMLGKAATLAGEPWSQASIHNIALSIAPVPCGIVSLQGLLTVPCMPGATATDVENTETSNVSCKERKWCQ